MAVTAFSATKRCVNGEVVRLDLAGEVRGPVVHQLATLIVDAVVVDLPDELIIDLDAVSFLDTTGVGVLIWGYGAAMDCGTLYRVVNARDQVHHALAAIGMVEVLADPQDIGAVLLALLTLPNPDGPDRRGSSPNRSQRAPYAPVRPRHLGGWRPRGDS